MEKLSPVARAVCVLVACVALAVPGAQEPARTVALMTVMPVGNGWAALGPTDSLIRAAGTVLQETIERVDNVESVRWTDTSGFKGLVESGLYRFQSDDAFAGWQELFAADAYVEMSIRDGAFEYAVHVHGDTQTGTVPEALKRPKRAIAAVANQLFASLGVELSGELRAELADPETTKPELFTQWAGWIGYIPNAYNDKPWDRPNDTATAIIKGDPEFLRGLTWALRMKLKPITKRGRPGTEIASPAMFDLHVLRGLNSRWAESLVKPYNSRLRADAHLLRDSLNILHVSGSSLDLGSMLDEADTAMPGSAIATQSAVKKTETTPRIRRYVCLALSGIENTKVVNRLCSTLADDPEPDVRAAAAESLGGFKVRDSVLKSIEAACRDKASEARLAALRSLARLRRTDSPAFRAARDDATSEVRWFVTSTVIDEAKDPDEAKRLLTDILAGDDASMRAFALSKATALFQKPESLLQAIGRALSSAHGPEQLAAMALVGHFKLVNLVPSVRAQLGSSDEDVRSQAAALCLELVPTELGRVAEIAGGDPAAGVQMALLDAISRQNDTGYAELIGKLIRSPHRDVRTRACNVAYALHTDDRERLARAMLADPSLRTNLAALRLIEGLRTPALIDELIWAVTKHPNEYIRADALRQLDRLDDPRCHDMALGALESPYFIVRLFAADILERRGTATDAQAVEIALGRATNPWMTMALEDALAHCTGQPKPEGVRLELGTREHTEGGELPNGWQLWLGDLPKDAAEARKLVDEGYRFGRVISAPTDQTKWGMRSWNNSVGQRNNYLLHLLDQIETFDKIAGNLTYCCLFDEPHTPGGANREDFRRAFLLELGRPDLLSTESDDDLREAEPEMPAYYRYYQNLTLVELTNWITKVVRLTLQRKYPDLRLFPQTMSYMLGATRDAFDRIDCDGDYSWSYDYNNLLGHYRRGAVMRAIHPGKPTAMVTWMGDWSPARFQLDSVYTDTKFPPGPWRLRNYMGTRAALALYASGIEPSYFNHVGYKSMSTKGKDTGGIRTFPLTPWSPALTDQINKMIKGDQSFHWDKVRDRIVAEVEKKYRPEDGEPGGGAADVDLDGLDISLDDVDAKIKAEVEERYNVEVETHFLNAMTGCSWMNIFNTDNTRALANLPKPDATPRDTLLVFPTDSACTGDGETFPMPAMALVQGFDMVPSYQSARLVDFSRYDTIMVRASREGVTDALVTKLNAWMRHTPGFLYVCGDLNTNRVLLPRMTFDKITQRLPWEEGVDVKEIPGKMVEYQDRRKKTRTRFEPAKMGAVSKGNALAEDPESGIRHTYDGQVDTLLAHGRRAVLARWRAPADIRATVVFDGAMQAGPVYTDALERIILSLDRERGAQIARNHYWGHVIYETDGFVIDVATSGYKSLQAARPRRHRGIDIIYGDINPEIVHGDSTLILKDYVGPYAGGVGDWAVMARTELKQTKQIDANTLLVHAVGVTRVSHIGDAPIALADSAGFVQVDDQLEVWKAMWEGGTAFSLNDVPGGRELHFSSPDPVRIVAGR